jgi:chromosome segregation ATPase
MQQTIQQIGKQLQEGQKVFKEASERADEVRRDYNKVENEHKQNLKELSQAKKQAEEEAKNSPGMKAARDKLEALRDELADVRQKVVDALTKDNTEYQASVKAHQDALAEQKAHGGSSVDQETRRALAKKVADADKQVKTIEDVAMLDNSDAKELNRKIKEAFADVAAAAKDKKEAIENDQRLSSAKVGFKRTYDELKQAKVNLDRAEGEAGRIRSTMMGLANQQAALQAQQQQIERLQNGGKGQGNQKGGRKY